MLFELFETIVRLRLERDKWKDVFVRIFRGQFEICSFRLGIFWPQSAPHSTDTALHTLISIYCGFKHNWALLSHIILVQIAICILFILDFHLWPVCKTYIGPSSRDQNWNNWLKQLNFFRPQQTTYWCCFQEEIVEKKIFALVFPLQVDALQSNASETFPVGRFLPRYQLLLLDPQQVHSPVFRELLFNKRSKSCDVGILEIAIWRSTSDSSHWLMTWIFFGGISILCNLEAKNPVKVYSSNLILKVIWGSVFPNFSLFPFYRRLFICNGQGWIGLGGGKDKAARTIRFSWDQKQQNLENLGEANGGRQNLGRHGKTRLIC